MIGLILHIILSIQFVLEPVKLFLSYHRSFLGFYRFQNRNMEYVILYVEIRINHHISTSAHITRVLLHMMFEDDINVEEQLSNVG